MAIARVREAYSARAAEYINRFGSIEAAAEQDREYVLAWARAVNGPILDVGCGPGQWTSYLHESGVDIEGVDPVAEFIKDARQRYPRVDYRISNAVPCYRSFCFRRTHLVSPSTSGLLATRINSINPATIPQSNPAK